jgi:hypothetical protein
MAPTLRPAYRVRPLDLGEILDEAFRIYRANFALMFGVALVATLPTLVQAIGSGSGGTMALLQQFQAASGNEVAPPDTSLFWLVGVGFLLAFIMLPITTAAPYFAASAVTLGLPATVGSILRDALRNYWRVWGLLLINLALALTMILILTIPFVVLILIRWSFQYPVLYLEHAGVGGSLSRSSALVKGSWWRIFGVLFIVGLMVGVIGFVVGAMGGLLSLVAPAGLARGVVSGVLSSLVRAVLEPYTAIAATLLYLDMRVRKESLDLQLMAGQAGDPGQAASGFPPPSASGLPAASGETPPAWGQTPPAWGDPPPSPPAWGEPPPPPPA